MDPVIATNVRQRVARWKEDELVSTILAPSGPRTFVDEGGSSWLHARLFGRPRLHDRLLAERLPALLESLPNGVDRWFFARPTGPEPHLRLSFGGDGDVLWTRLLSNLRSWMVDLVANEFAAWSVIDVCQPMDVDPMVTTDAVDVLQADSDAVLAQLRLTRARAFGISASVLLTSGLADTARAFHGDTWRADQLPGTPDAQALLTPWWQSRAEALALYGSRVRRLAAADNDAVLVDAVLNSLLLLHANRVGGTLLAQHRWKSADSSLLAP